MLKVLYQNVLCSVDNYQFFMRKGREPGNNSGLSVLHILCASSASWPTRGLS